MVRNVLKEINKKTKEVSESLSASLRHSEAVQSEIHSLERNKKTGQCKIKTADCRLWTRGKMQTESKMQTAD